MSPVRPFSCGSQYMDWQEHNCFQCKKLGEGAEPQCEISVELVTGCFGDGTVPDEIGKRMGYTQGPPFYYIWDCPERELK